MGDLNQAGVGVYSNYWEYRRGVHRRLFSFDNFCQDEVLNLGKILERVGKINDYQKVLVYTSA